jgi:hypothetical protein
MDLNGFTGAACGDERRRAAVLEHPSLNGIDFVEYVEDRSAAPSRFWLAVTFLKIPPDASFYGLVGDPASFHVEGGARIVGITVTSVTAGAQQNQLKIGVSGPGDFSTYVLSIDSAALDPQLSAVAFGFKAGCPSDFDCRQEAYCPPTALSEPALDYLAKDYASFRRLLLDLIPQLNPDWIERNPADLGMALVELLAYAGDNLSYFQDAVATEMYLDTAQHRISARRHARLIDYQMHDGRNAWTYVQLSVSVAGIVSAGTPLLSRIALPLRGQTSPPGAVIPAADLQFEDDPVLQDVAVFETTARIALHPLLNELVVHTWGDRDCCLPRGATGLHLYGVVAGTQQVAPALPLHPGDFILLEEVKGPVTGLGADADPTHRQVVRLLSVETATDPLFRDTLVAGDLQPVTATGQTPLPLTKVTWSSADALSFPLCLSATHPDTGFIDGISVVRGNVVPADHGRTVEDALPAPDSLPCPGGLMTLPLPRSPLTIAPLPPSPSFDAEGRLQQDRFDLAGPPTEAMPSVVLLAHDRTLPPGESEIWTPALHLLNSHAYDTEFVTEIDNDGGAVLRFGDDEYGRSPIDVDALMARYRVGNGHAGNLGRESLVHVVTPSVIAGWPTLTGVLQPLAASQGTDPESVEEVRQHAPAAFHAEQFRAVTESDYEAAALKLASVAAAKCAFRWTGSWHTVFVAVQPSDPADLIMQSGGRTLLSESFQAAVTAQLTRYKLAGYDLQIQSAQYVPLKISVRICIASGYLRGDVLLAVSQALSNRRNPDGSTGFFYSTNFAFGQPVYLSRLYAAIEAVEGVRSAVVTFFQRYWMVANGELESGVITLGPWEIARLDNDPNFQESGVLELTAVGGL